MFYSPQAFFDTDIGVQHARKFCISGTRVQILVDLEAWATTSSSSSATGYWISGMAGTGKSTIAMSICQKLRQKRVLAGSFFCSRQIPECRDYRAIIPTLSYQLAKFSQGFAVALKDALTRDFNLARATPTEQIKHLLIEPWKTVSDVFWKI
ncbi:hypothetical protein GYMLUDRAFT_157974 [Collybiopsis luxurians FD-317 M1]|nr:hypothetical protein GYMLUDRAFT_157974 [Collybiopsis luxurians FD-317 M1]